MKETEKENNSGKIASSVFPLLLLIVEWLVYWGTLAAIPHLGNFSIIAKAMSVGLCLVLIFHSCVIAFVFIISLFVDKK